MSIWLSHQMHRSMAIYGRHPLEYRRTEGFSLKMFAPLLSTV
jgi:hypothetical protein